MKKLIYVMLVTLLAIGCRKEEEEIKDDGGTATKPKVVRVIASSRCSFAIKSDGSLWGWGDNSYGQLGIGSAIQKQNTPIKIMDNVKDIAHCYYATLVIKKDGTLWGFGYNADGGWMFGNDWCGDAFIYSNENDHKILYTQPKYSYTYLPIQLGSAGNWNRFNQILWTGYTINNTNNELYVNTTNNYIFDKAPCKNDPKYYVWKYTVAYTGFIKLSGTNYLPVFQKFIGSFGLKNDGLWSYQTNKRDDANAPFIDKKISNDTNWDYYDTFQDLYVKTDGSLWKLVTTNGVSSMQAFSYENGTKMIDQSTESSNSGHYIKLLTNGEVYTKGTNLYGQCGNGTYTDVYEWTKINL